MIYLSEWIGKPSEGPTGAGKEPRAFAARVPFGNERADRSASVPQMSVDGTDAAGGALWRGSTASRVTRW